jgi:hypothetical protein
LHKGAINLNDIKIEKNLVLELPGWSINLKSIDGISKIRKEVKKARVEVTDENGDPVMDEKTKKQKIEEKIMTLYFFTVISGGMSMDCFFLAENIAKKVRTRAWNLWIGWIEDNANIIFAEDE